MAPRTDPSQPPQIECSHGDCDYQTPPNCPTWDLARDFLTQHTHAVHATGQQQASQAGKLEKLPRPTFTLNMTESQWSFTKTQWDSYIKQTVVPESVKVMQLQAACDKDLRQRVFDTGNYDSLTTEGAFLSKMKELAVIVIHKSIHLRNLWKTVQQPVKPWISEKLKQLKRTFMREYEKRGRTSKYFELKSSYDARLLKEAQKYKEKLESEVKSGDRTSCYAALRKLGGRPGEPEVQNTFTLANHMDRKLSPQQSVEVIADHFAAISQDYEPISISALSPKIKQALSNPRCVGDVPTLQEYEVYRKICKAKKPNSTVPGDIPKRILREFSCELATPATIIFNSILRTFEYPRQWVKEHQIPIPKVTPPVTEDDLRNIAKTAFLSKIFESFLASWLMPMVQSFS